MIEIYNAERPLVMHIDLNSCFATVEQQARPLLRGKPIAVVNRRTEHTSIVTASYEAKALGVSVGMRVKDAVKLVPGLVTLESEPAKYRFVYHKLMSIMKQYSAHITMKSIDEGVIDFKQSSELIRSRDLKDIGNEMKRRLQDEIGSAMRCNVGIAPNRFLAKTAAGLHKPDGLDVIEHTNLRSTLQGLRLTDLTGIAEHNQDRLNAVGIYTPLQFLDADARTLQTMVFKSVLGKQWHQRLRGYEVDDVVHDLKTVGRQYVLEAKNLPYSTVIQRLHHLCESVGGKLRSQRKAARGVLVYAKTREYGYWQARHMCDLPFFSDTAIYAQARLLFGGVPGGDIREIGIRCYELSDDAGDQLSLFGDTLAREQYIVDAIDAINKRFGERTIHAAHTLDTGRAITQKIPFGSTRYL
jgi:DNA polymerase-4